jgi:DNA-binding NarL/FixJ family response regulator
MGLASAARIVLVGASAGAADWLRKVISDDGSGAGCEIRCAGGVEEAAAQVGAAACDLIVVDLDALSQESTFAVVRRLGEAFPAVPLVAVATDCSDELTIAALQAGADECLRKDASRDAARHGFDHAMAHASSKAAMDERRIQAEHDRELRGLSTLCGPSPLPITERSFGMVSLASRAPQQFAKLVRIYGVVLDAAMQHRSMKHEGDLTVELSDLADQLGMLGAGPRDVIDLHKAVIAAGIQGQGSRRAKTYLEESRLLLLQLMGYLVSFYRNLSWGQGTGWPSRLTLDESSAAKKGKDIS